MISELQTIYTITKTSESLNPQERDPSAISREGERDNNKVVVTKKKEKSTLAKIKSKLNIAKRFKDKNFSQGEKVMFVLEGIGIGICIALLVVVLV